MQLLIIGYVWPEPSSSAAGSRMLSIIKTFKQQGWSIVFATAAAPTTRQVDLNQLGISTYQIQVNDSAIDTWLQSVYPNVVLFDRFMIEEQFSWRVKKYIPHALRILNTEDFHSLRYARHNRLKQGCEVITAQMQTLELFNASSQREVAAIYRSDLALMISQAEIELLKSDFNIDQSLLHYLPFLLDIDAIPYCDNKHQCTSIEEREHFVTVGNFRHGPNLDALHWLRQAIWPKIKRQLPKAELFIYGAYPTPSVMQLDNPNIGFRVLGAVDTVAPIFKKARVCLAPLRFGAGLKGKLVDAMFYGVPNVTTPIGTEGMKGTTSEWSGLEASCASTFVASAIKLYTNAELWYQSRKIGYQLLQSQFDEKHHGLKLVSKINELITCKPEHRNKNFIGQMLWHHRLRSTEFMSRWIELKNTKRKIE